ncbi:MAG: lysophospholipid acyltransferase family protein [Rhodoferax sp.]|jgi:KDO2-lipid IV(A) lauroyltransferase|nr:lysophospholipid acyltransferase family protein [Rhodoferax sp.]
MATAFRLFSGMPLWLLHALGGLLGWLAFATSATYRRRFLSNARVAGYSFGEVRPAVASAGRMVAELPRLWLGAAPHCEWVNEACVDQAYEAGRGVVFLTPHLGCFEITAQGLAQRYAARYGPLTVLYRPARQAWLAALMADARNRPGLETAPTTLAGVRQMIRALRRGHAVGLLPDQVPPAGMGQWAPFFGQDAYTMTLSARLAQQTGATVLLLWGERLPLGRGYRLHFRALQHPLAADLQAAVCQVNQEMEALVRACPGQYLWGYARYKQPKGDTA